MAMTTQQIKMLAQIERDMDAGTVPFVVCEGHRMAVNKDVMHELGLVSGQTINQTIMTAILRQQIAQLQTKIVLVKAQQKLDTKNKGPER